MLSGSGGNNIHSPGSYSDIPCNPSLLMPAEMYAAHADCTCGEDQPDFTERECREFYWNRRRLGSGRREEAIMEESSGGEEAEERGTRHHRGSSVSADNTWRRNKEPHTFTTL